MQARAGTKSVNSPSLKSTVMFGTAESRTTRPGSAKVDMFIWFYFEFSPRALTLAATSVPAVATLIFLSISLIVPSLPM